METAPCLFYLFPLLVQNPGRVSSNLMHWNKGLKILDGNVHRKSIMFSFPSMASQPPTGRGRGVERGKKKLEEGVYFYFYTELCMIIAKLVIFYRIIREFLIIHKRTPNYHYHHHHPTYKHWVCPRPEKEKATVK